MKKVLILTFLLLLIAGAGFAVYVMRGREQTLASLQVTSVPQGSVLLDGKEIGKTPFRGNIATGEHTVKITPEGFTNLSFEEKLSFLPNILTVIDRNFNEAGGSGYTLTLTPLEDQKEVQITVISSPTEAAVTLDSELKGITPVLIKDVTASNHELLVLKDKYSEKRVRVRTVQGYQLIARVDLAIQEEAEAPQEVNPPPTPIASPSAQIRIGQTPNNFLRVRETPTLSGKEIARVKTGETFPLLEEQTGWYKIKLSDGKEGWVSGQFAQKITQ